MTRGRRARLSRVGARTFGGLALAALLVAAPARAEDVGALPRCGAASVSLRARDDMVIAGGIGPGGARGQEGDLRASALVVDAGGDVAAIVACDILMIRRDKLDRACQRIAEEVGVPFENVLVNATHTHHAPSTVTIHDYARDEEFCDHVVDAVVDATRRAMERRSPTAMGFRLGQEATVGRNSRFLLSDGTVWWTGPHDDEVRPTGPFDPELPVLSFRSREAGRLEALLFNHSTHLIGTVEPGVRSPSFYGLAAQAIERDFGGTAVFLAGAFGSTHDTSHGCEEMTLRIDRAVRGALERSVAVDLSLVRSRKREITYRVRDFDEAAEDAAVTAYCEKRLGPGAPYIIGVFRDQRAKLAEHRGEVRRTWVQALRIGDVAIATAPGELFTSLGVEIKRRSPFRYTYVAGVANDYIGYIPDRDAYELGGYQVWTGLHSFVEAGTGERIVDVAIELLEELR